MSGPHHQPLKQEPTIKQEYNINDIPQYHYPPVDSFSQLIDPFPSAAFVPTMTYQYSSDSYYSSSTQESCQDSIQGSRQDSIQDSSGYYDQTTDQWADFEAPDEYATSPDQDNSFPSSMPLYYDEHAYLDNDMQQTPAVQMERQNPKYVRLTLDRGVSSNFVSINSKGEIWQCLKCPSHFTRCADLNRHYATVHNPAGPKKDCPRKKCTRVGDNGFTRKDHLMEHLRQYHKDQTIPKRGRK
jgi:hypothetical protein